MQEIWANYSAEVIMDLTFTDVNGTTNPYTIPPGSTVEAIVKDSQGTPVTVKKASLEADPKADWPNGRMVTKWTAAETANIPGGQQGVVEASVGVLPVQTARVQFIKGEVPLA